MNLEWEARDQIEKNEILELRSLGAESAGGAALDELRVAIEYFAHQLSEGRQYELLQGALCGLAYHWRRRFKKGVISQQQPRRPLGQG